ncbi:MAG: (Fe-S)-binding protein [Phycisphaerae bacterium]
MSPLLMSLLLVVGLGFFAATAARRWRLMIAARAADPRCDQPAARWAGVMTYMFGQARMFRYSAAGIAHAFIFGGFVVLALRTLILFARGFTSDEHFGFWLFDDDVFLGRVYLLLKDVIGILVIIGVTYFLYLRLGPRPKRMKHSAEGIFILCMILGIVLSDACYEAAAYVRQTREPELLTRALNAEMARAADDVARGGDAGRASQAVTDRLNRTLKARHWHTPLATTLAQALRRAPDAPVDALYYGGFWLHALIVLTFLNFLPYGKHFHVLTVLPNVYFRDLGGIGRLRTIDDIEGRIERSETLGVAKAADLSWKSVLDLYTCTECGRCSDQCPATRTGKLLSPKHLTLELRDHMYRNERAFVAGGGAANRAADGAGATNEAGSSGAAAGSVAANDTSAFVRADGSPDETQGLLIPAWINPETLWACTTCGACEQECPVFISYVDKIVDLRRNLVMERGEFPDQLQNAFRGLESVGNPYSFPNDQRAAWAVGLGVPLRSEKPDADVLFWVGCAPSFDDRARKIARATAQLLKQAGVEFAILGPEEQCTGDPARRAGNEYLFQTFAKTNVETLNNHGVRKVVTTCPHCFNTLANEYPDFGGKFDVVHHTTFLHELIRAGRLRPQHRVDGTITYHDSCYLGRYNEIYDPPRDILRAIPGLTVVDAPESRDRGMCCGAGGAQMWKEEEHIRRTDSDERGRVEGAGKVNHLRARQLLRVLPASAVTAPGGAGTRSLAHAATAPDAPSSAPDAQAPPKKTGCGRAIASACPFCMTMLRDGLRDQGHEDVSQLDVAEVLWKSVSGE